MEADDALARIQQIQQLTRFLSDGSHRFLTELAADLATTRKVEPTQEDLHELQAICLRVGIDWEEVWTPDIT